jgi:hypothetical protein
MQRGDFRPKMKKAPRRIRAGRISIAQEREREYCMIIGYT